MSNLAKRILNKLFGEHYQWRRDDWEQMIDEELHLGEPVEERAITGKCTCPKLKVGQSCKTT